MIFLVRAILSAVLSRGIQRMLAEDDQICHVSTRKFHAGLHAVGDESRFPGRSAVDGQRLHQGLDAIVIEDFLDVSGIEALAFGHQQQAAKS